MKEHQTAGQAAAPEIDVLDDAPTPAPADLPLEEWTVEHHLARQQTENARRGGARRPKAVANVETTEPAPGVRVERGMIANPAGRTMVATFVKVTSPDVAHVVDTELRRSRAIVARAGSIAPARRPRCQPGRRRGAGRPARRPSRTTSRSSAASGDSGPGDSDEPGDAGHLTLAPRATHTCAVLTSDAGRRA